jgi:hypothetical protein
MKFNAAFYARWGAGPGVYRSGVARQPTVAKEEAA